MNYLNKYLKYKEKYLALKNQMYGSARIDQNLLYKKYSYLKLSESDIILVRKHSESKELKREIEEFVKIYYLEDSNKGLPYLVSTNSDIYAESKIDPSESEELKIKIKKVHLLYQALKTGNKILLVLIDNYWSKFMDPNNTILEIWKSLPYNYKMTYNLLNESIENGFIDIFEILCAHNINKDSFYTTNKDSFSYDNGNVFKRIYEHALYLIKEKLENQSWDRQQTIKFLDENFFPKFFSSKSLTNCGISKEMDNLCIYIHRIHKDILGHGLSSDYFRLSAEILGKI